MMHDEHRDESASSTSNLTKAELRARGWTDKTIAVLLGAPDQVKKNRWNRKVPIKLYDLAKVEEAEKTDVFYAGRWRRIQAREVARSRAAKLQAEVETWPVTVLPGALANRRREAIDSYNARLSVREMERGEYLGDPATPKSDRAFLRRITLNYLRHECSNYEEILARLRGRVGVDDAVEIARERVNRAIVEMYPELAPKDEETTTSGVGAHDSVVPFIPAWRAMAAATPATAPPVLEQPAGTTVVLVYDHGSASRDPNAGAKVTVRDRDALVARYPELAVLLPHGVPRAVAKLGGGQFQVRELEGDGSLGPVVGSVRPAGRRAL